MNKYKCEKCGKETAESVSTLEFGIICFECLGFNPEEVVKKIEAKRLENGKDIECKYCHCKNCISLQKICKNDFHFCIKCKNSWWNMEKEEV